jgi:hypothetical protein
LFQAKQALMVKSNGKKDGQQGPATEKPETCGIIMPISGSSEYPAEHWIDVKFIFEEAIRDAGLTPNLVSSADEVRVIHSTIVSNIYNNPVVVCDISSRNPNVMFELGLRLAFDRATIIVKDVLRPTTLTPRLLNISVIREG